MSEKWDAFGPAVNDTVAKLIALGLPKSAEVAAGELVWRLGAWQGDREFKNGRLDLAERAYKLAVEVNAAPKS